LFPGVEKSDTVVDPFSAAPLGRPPQAPPTETGGNPLPGRRCWKGPGALYSEIRRGGFTPAAIVPQVGKRGLKMTIDKSLRVRKGLMRSRNVLTRAERIEKLSQADRWEEGDPVLGLPKVRVVKVSLKKKKKAKKEEEEKEAEAK
jgi:small basic protein (TIGR04137 family)